VASRSAIQALLSSLRADSSEDDIVAVIRGVQGMPEPDADIVARLAEVLAASGTRMRPQGGITADVASTGGPSSLSTLLCPLYLRAWGAVVPKLGVPGRPAGGIDCLAQIPGYSAGLDRQRLVAVLGRCGYAHFLADGEMAPLDGRMFRLRQQIGAQGVPALVASSLLSKKLAVGVQNAGLDIRVAPWGNFGKTWEDARANAGLYCDAARRLGISPHPILTDARLPYQPFLGRAESLVALDKVFRETAEGDLAIHANLCRSLAAVAMSGHAPLTPTSGQTLRDIFNANLEAQGADPDAFVRVVNATASGHRFALRARQGGFYRVSLAAVRDLFVGIQRSRVGSGTPFPDPVGAQLLRRAGEWVDAGDQVASVRADDAVWQEYGKRIAGVLADTTLIPAGAGFEGVDNGQW